MSTTYREEFSVEGDILIAKVSGVFPKKLLWKRNNAFSPLIWACKEHRKKRVLVDSRELSVKLGVMDLFKAGADLASLPIGGLHIAVLAREDQLNKLFEDVARLRGANLCVLTKPEDAKEWLVCQPA